VVGAGGCRPVLVAVSAYADLGDEARRAGFDHLLRKTADPDHLVRVLDAVPRRA
jgi:CheY-like chemotaxis protein